MRPREVCGSPPSIFIVTFIASMERSESISPFVNAAKNACAIRFPSSRPCWPGEWACLTCLRVRDASSCTTEGSRRNLAATSPTGTPNTSWRRKVVRSNAERCLRASISLSVNSSSPAAPPYGSPVEFDSFGSRRWVEPHFKDSRQSVTTMRWGNLPGPVFQLDHRAAISPMPRAQCPQHDSASRGSGRRGVPVAGVAFQIAQLCL